MNIQILAPATEDLIAGYRFYEKQSIGVGDYFLSSLYSDIDSLMLYAGIHRKKFGFYWMLSKRFPFAIYYDIKDDSVFVLAVLDCRQNPRTIAKRMAKEGNDSDNI